MYCADTCFERFFPPLLKKGVKITWYFNKTDDLASHSRSENSGIEGVHGNGLIEEELSLGTLVPFKSRHLIPVLG